jgi:hypothetical protein
MSVIRRTPVDLGAVEHGIDHLETVGNFDAAAAVRHLREENFALARQLAGAVSETEQLRHEVQARDDVIYHAAEHLRHALDVIATYEDRITTSGQ